MRVLLVNNKRISQTIEMAREVSAYLRAAGIEVLIDSSKEDITSEDFDAIIVLGGDGTFIRSTRQYVHKNVPILGVNMGTVGFLSNIQADELGHYLGRFISQNYDIEERMVLEAILLANGTPIKTIYSLNEVCIKSKSSRIISLDVRIDDRKHGIYRGDGLIIASPLGSTAYSLSCGGPVTDPDLEVFVMTPIGAFSLNKRPMVISANKEIEVIPLECAETVVYVDGQVTMDFKNNCALRIKKADYKLKLVNMEPRYFFETIMKRLRRSDEDLF